MSAQVESARGEFFEVSSWLGHVGTTSRCLGSRPASRTVTSRTSPLRIGANEASLWARTRPLQSWAGNRVPSHEGRDAWFVAL